MAKFDFNNIDDLKKLKNEVDTILESRIRKIELDSEIDTLADKAFGSIKNVFEGITDKLYETAKGKKMIAEYAKTIRNGKNVSDAYSIYEFVFNAPNVSNPDLFLNEAVSMTENFDVKNYKKEKENVAKIVGEAVRFVGKDAEFIKEAVERNGEMNRDVEYLICNKKTFSNLDEYVNRFENVKSHLEENMKGKPVNEGKTGKELVAALNETLEGLADFEKNAIRDISIAKLSKSDLSQLFEQYKNECLEKIDESIDSETSIETKSHLETMKKQLNEKKYNEESLYEDIVTLSELKATLSE